MMRCRIRLPTLLLIVVVASAVACATSEVIRNFGQRVFLDYGRMALFPDGLRVTFTGVISDSRCPINVTCVQAGEAVIELTCSLAGKTQRVRLTSNQGRADNHAEVFAHPVTLLNVGPQASTFALSRNEYAVTIRVD
jgi:hypothetical protein